MFHMSSDSGLFRTARQLSGDGLVREGGDWISQGKRPVQGTLAVEGGGAGSLPLVGGGQKATRYVPLYEGKMAFFFDHRYGDFAAAEEKDDADYREIPTPSLDQLQDPTFEVLSRYWVPKVELDNRLEAKGWDAGWLFAHRGLTNATNERTFVTFVLPRVGVGNSIPAWIFERSLDRRKIAALTANTGRRLCAILPHDRRSGEQI